MEEAWDTRELLEDATLSRETAVAPTVDLTSQDAPKAMHILAMLAKIIFGLPTFLSTFENLFAARLARHAKHI